MLPSKKRPPFTEQTTFTPHLVPNCGTVSLRMSHVRWLLPLLFLPNQGCGATINFCPTFISSSATLPPSQWKPQQHLVMTNYPDNTSIIVDNGICYYYFYLIRTPMMMRWDYSAVKEWEFPAPPLLSQNHCSLTIFDCQSHEFTGRDIDHNGFAEWFCWGHYGCVIIMTSPQWWNLVKMEWKEMIFYLPALSSIH